MMSERTVNCALCEQDESILGSQRIKSRHAVCKPGVRIMGISKRRLIAALQLCENTLNHCMLYSGAMGPTRIHISESNAQIVSMLLSLLV
jgi:hypothetical protein